MQHGTEVQASARATYVLDGDPLHHEKGTAAPYFSAYDSCGQWLEVSRCHLVVGTEVDQPRRHYVKWELSSLM